MIEKYYNGVIEQVVGGIGNVEHNSILVRYSNDFSYMGFRECQSL